MQNKAGIVCFAMLVCALSPPLSAQQSQLTDVSIQGFVYEPQRLPPTDERTQSLQVPEGFQIQRFAEGLGNPRMLAVADDGTVYVTQRTPGNLVMLRDTDNDGIADVALDTTLDLPDGFNRHALLQAMRGHVLAEGELVGVFQAPE